MKIVVSFALLLLVISSGLQAQEVGKASYYSNDFQGSKTYFGEIYDKDKFTAAHKVHPLGTRLKVTRLDNNRSVVVRVNDRGPYIKGRIIDVSYAAAAELGMVQDGVVDVKVEVISTGSGRPEPATEASREAARPTGYSNPPATSAPPAGTQARSGTPAAAKPETAAATKLSELPEDYRERMVRGAFNPEGLYEVKLFNVNNAGYGLQVASLTSYENMLQQVAELQDKWIDNVLVRFGRTGNKTTFKVIIGPFESRAQAESYQKNFQKKHKLKGFIVDLSE